MERDLQILVNTPGQLTVVAPPNSFDLTSQIFWAVMLVVGVWMTWRLWRVSRWAASGLIVVGCVGALVLFASDRTSDRLTIDRPANSLTWESYDSSGTLSSQQVKLSDVERADMDFNRVRRRIVVSLHNGQKIYPLGSGFDYKDSQYKVLDLIRGHIGPQPYATGQLPAGRN